MAIIHLTGENFDEAVKHGIVLVDFWADWCGPCGMLAPVIEDLDREYEGRILIAKVNVDEQQELAQQFEIMSIPTVLFLKDGTEVDRKIGLMPMETYTGILKKLLPGD